MTIGDKDASRNVKLNDCSLANETLPHIDSIVFLLKEALPNVDRNSLIGMVQKSLELVRTGFLMVNTSLNLTQMVLLIKWLSLRRI